jgi:hypothetical protein
MVAVSVASVNVRRVVGPPEKTGMFIERFVRPAHHSEQSLEALIISRKPGFTVWTAIDRVGFLFVRARVARIEVRRSA